MATIGLRGVVKRYPGGALALRGLDLEVGGGERVAVVGASGSGKTTLLRVIAGLEEPTEGRVWLGGRDVTAWEPWRRDVGLAFQNPAVMPHLTVFENLAFGLRARSRDGAAIRERVRETASRLRIGGLLDRMPAALSGGERQRVALGRALARRPAVLLLDEPFAGLDTPLRRAIREDLQEVVTAWGVTTVLVTHDQAEAFAWGERVAVLDRGELLQAGPPAEVGGCPASTRVAAFLGDPPMPLLDARLERFAAAPRLLLLGSDGSRVEVGGRLPRVLGGFAEGRLRAGIRPEAVAPGEGPRDWGERATARVTGRVVLATFTGRDFLVRVALGALGEIYVRQPDGPPPGGVPLGLTIDLDAACWFDGESGRRIG